MARIKHPLTATRDDTGPESYTISHFTTVDPRRSTPSRPNRNIEGT